MSKPTPQQYCDTCGDSYKEKNRSRDTVRQEAKKLSNEKNIPIALFETSPGVWDYAEASFAYQANQAVREIVYRL